MPAICDEFSAEYSKVAGFGSHVPHTLTPIAACQWSVVVGSPGSDRFMRISPTPATTTTAEIAYQIHELRDRRADETARRRAARVVLAIGPQATRWRWDFSARPRPADP